MNTHRAISAAAVFVAAAAIGMGAGKAALQAATQVFVTNTTSSPVPSTIVNAPSVKVANTSGAPFWIKDVNNEAFNGRQVFLTFNLAVGQSQGVLTTTVPAGYRFVVREVMAQGQSAAGNEFPTALYVTAHNAQNVVHANWGGIFSVEPGSTANSLLQAQTFFYGDTGDTLVVTVHRINSTNTAVVNVTLSGYLFKLP